MGLGELLPFDCGHEFGDTCLGQWIALKRQAREVMSCPVCRCPITKTQAFRPWGKKQGGGRSTGAAANAAGAADTDSMDVEVGVGVVVA